MQESQNIDFFCVSLILVIAKLIFAIYNIIMAFTKPMLLADCIDDKKTMANIAEALYKEPPEYKKKCQRKN